MENTLPKDQYVLMMESWMEAAKSCGQLAMAAMFLPVFVARDLLGVDKGAAMLNHINGSFLLAWAGFILAIALSHTYQISATTLIHSFEAKQPRLFPRLQFWLMVASLLGGMALFVNGSLEALHPST
ncbi:hypothetical protein [Aquabacterium commune]|uniref:hypothetical protein n=1 Tax=Aquabacterium commune TaxID=70586 RepID=UPI003BB223A8